MEARSWSARLGSIVLVSAAALGLACQAAFAGAAASGGAHITILADATRIPEIEAFEKAYPSIKVTIETYTNVGNDDNEQKFALYNKAGSGWPDVFFAGGYQLAWASGSAINYTANIGPGVPAKTRAGFAKSVLSVCEQGGKLVCLTGGIGQVVLWYNASLFRQWGYTPPSTWQQYEALSLKIATEHPGYYTGLVGDVNTPSRYLWPSGCPTSTLLAPMAVRIDLNAPTCTRVEHMLSTLLAAKVLSPIGLFDPDAATQVGANLVMTPGASWYGRFIFQADFKVPAGQMTATLPLHWAGEKPGTGEEGGDIWMVSRHTTGQNLAAAIKAVTFITTNRRVLTNAVTFPSYVPGQQWWLDQQGKDKYFADYGQVETAFKTAATEIRTDTNYALFNPANIWSQTVTPALAQGASFESGWNAFGNELVQQAQSYGYKVEH